MTLDELGIKYGTDKSSKHHNYLHQYEFWLSRFKGQKIIACDAVGAYHYKDRGGESLRMWAEFEPLWTIVGIDLYEKDIKVPENVLIFQADQTDEARLKEIFDQVGRPHFFCEDFSHKNFDSIRTFEIVFPLLESGGIYILEDCESSFYSEHGFGGTKDCNDFQFPSSLNYFRKMVNELNAKFIENFNQSEIGKSIESIHFYTNFVLIIKK